MSWPRKDNGLRLYFERAKKSYLLVDHSARGIDGSFEYIGEVMIDNNPLRPLLATGTCDSQHLYRKCRRAAWNDMPEVWQRTLRPWLTECPENSRGLWRMPTK